MPRGWMNRGAPSSSALAHTGWNFGSEKSTPFTELPIAAPLSPCFLTATSLLHGEIGCLQGKRGKGRETIGVRGAEFGQLFVLEFHDLRGKIAFTVVPEGVDRQDLHVDGLRIHRGEPLAEFDKGLLRSGVRAGLKPWPLLTQQRAGFAEITMRVHIDGLDPLAVDGDG